MSDIERNAVEEIEVDEETARNTLRTYENDILGGLLAAAGYKNDEDEIVPVEIVRNGTLLLKFHVRPLSEDEYLKGNGICKIRVYSISSAARGTRSTSATSRSESRFRRTPTPTCTATR